MNNIIFNVLVRMILLLSSSFIFWIAYKILVPLVFISYYMPTYVQCVVIIFLFNIIYCSTINDIAVESNEATK